MDSDDNDFRCQNFQLVAEDNSKFPPNLCPFPLPKFDIDEHLQGHLRFDNLVETEELLGIQGHGNNWVEEFSPGGSPIEFSSNAAESCSISRHNNVWSEATSSESVEMLLKSVGEDEMMDQKTTIKKIDAHDGLNNMDGQNDSLLRQIGSENSKMIDVTHTNLALPPDKCYNILSGLDADALGVQPQAECMFQASENQKSGIEMEAGSLSGKFNSEGNIAADECSMENKVALSSDYATKNSSVIGEIVCEENQNENAVQNALVKKCEMEDHDCIAMAAKDLDLVIVPGKLNTPTELMVEECREIDISEKLDHLADDPQKERIQIIDSKITDQPSQSIELTGGVFSAKESVSLEPPLDSLMLLNERCSDPEFSKNSDLLSAGTCQEKVLTKGSLIIDRITLSMERSFIGLDKNSENSVEISTGDIVRLPNVMEGFTNSGYEGAEQPPEHDGSHAENTLLVENFCIIDGYKERKLDILSESVEEKQVAEVQLSGNSNSDVENMPNLKMHSSTDMHCEIPTKVLSNDDDLGFKKLHSVSPNSKSICIAKHAEGEVPHDFLKKSDVELNIQKDEILEESLSPALLNHAMIPFTLCSKSSEMCEAGTVVAEPHEVYNGPEVMVITKESKLSSMDSHRANNDASMVPEEMEVASSSGQRTPTPSIADCSSTLKLIQCRSGKLLSELYQECKTPEATTSTKENPSSSLFSCRAEPKSDTSIALEKMDSASSGGPKTAVSALLNCSSTIIQGDSEITRTDESLPTELKNPSSGDFQNKLQQSDSNLYPRVHCCVQIVPSLPTHGEGDSLYHSTKCSAESLPVGGSNVVSDKLEAGSANPNSFDQNCGTATVNSYQEDNREEQDQMNPVLDDPPFETSETRVYSNKVICGSHGSKESAAAEDDSSFTFESLPISRSNTAFHKLEAESASPNIFDQNCGSPTVNSCSKRPQEANREKQDRVGPVSDDQPFETSETVRCSSHGSKESAAAEEERRFTFESLPVTIRITESHKLEAESANQNCSSLTVLSCSKHPQEGIYQSGNREQQDQMDSISDDQPFETSETRMNSIEVICSAHGLGVSSGAEDGKSFTFEVETPPDICGKDSNNERKSSPSLQSFELPQIPKENSEGHLLELKEGEPHETVSKTPDEDKPSEVSGCLKEGLSTSQVESSKETQILKQIVMDVDPCSTPSESIEIISSNIDLEMPHYPYIKSGIKASCSPTVQTCFDLNSSVSAVLFHQPFTDLQQVQLRAQIFVYGSLIQTIPPDEACMISAFGGTDGGRSLWEGLWRIFAESYQNQKSPFSNSESRETTPSHSYPAVQVTWSSALESKAPGTPSQSVSKTVSTPMLDSAVLVPSPLWNNSPWQTPRPGPWIMSSQNSTHDSAVQFAALSTAETVKVTPARGFSVPDSHTLQFVSLPLLTTNVSEKSAMQIETQRKATIPGNSKNATGQNSRKRKKSTVPEESLPNIVVPLPEPPSAGVNKKLQTPSVALSKPASSPTKVVSDGLVSAATRTISPTHYQIVSGGTKQRAIFSEKICSKIEQAKQQAEDAAALAASAAMHSQGIWSQLATQKKTGLISKTDEKLSSAAVAAAAAASVAKAAAAAAKVASDAALQAKLMADEVVSSARAGNCQPLSDSSLLDVGKNLGRLTPVSVLMGKDWINGSSSIISAAREADRRRLESTSAATKRAENLDAIVKAAELAAEAVSQAGTIVAMGEPLPFTLSELVEAGMDGHWRVCRSTTGERSQTNSQYQDCINSDGAGNNDKTVEQFKVHPSNDKGLPESSDKERNFSSNEHHIIISDKCDRVYGSDNVLSSVPTDELEKDHVANNKKDVSIQKGSLVEVVSDDDGLRRVWFSANVLEVKDGKAYVCYNDLLSSEGTGKLTKWVSLKVEGNMLPRIRLAHPVTTAKYEGLRKRRRAALGNHAWAIGDWVDAWMRDGWCEGIVTEKSQEDETQLTVHFTDGGDSSVIRAWDLRPSLVWKDCRWIEWSRPKDIVLQERDTPNEKRQKVAGVEARVCPEIDGKVIGNVSKNLPVEDSRKPSESGPLGLTTKDNVFSVGNNGREVKNSDAHRLRRVALEKEGSRVVIGVPKPGKKRKFMEVSKHFVADKAEKTNGGSDSIKFAKYLMPQVSRAWKNTIKLDPKGKSVGYLNPKGLKAVKPSMQTRSTTEKENLSNATSTVGAEAGHGSLPNARATFRNEHNNIEKKNLEVGTFTTTGGKLGNSHVDASMQPVPSIASSKKSSSAVDMDTGLKGKFTPLLNKLRRRGESYEDSGKVASDASEPRRSNRRIQPTSRLLEGLQSSLTISKIPSFSHEKGATTQHRGASSRGNSHG